ncbi:MAG: hypothetical protein ACRDRS_06445 [Pseudonocardiaceae bacterium]
MSTGRDDTCPHCESTKAVQRITGPPLVGSGWCPECGLEWAFTHVDPPLAYLAPGAWSVLRQVITLAERADTLTEEELRSRLRALIPQNPGRPPVESCSPDRPLREQHHPLERHAWGHS